MSATASARVPVTVLTGFLGSGKTTLLNRILSEQHGKRIAVIENEFGEVGVDQDLVINAEEEVFEMNNGCICCTVRGDLIRILGNLMKRRDKFDYILIETTGMADPGPVAQTFFVDDEMQQKLQLDGIVTLVDAKHISMHIDDSDEAQEQIAFADVIVLNKIDLVTPAELAAVEARIAQINSAAKIYRAENAQIDLDKVLHVGGFNLDRAMDVDPQFMEPEYPFEWGGAYLLEPGRYELRLPVPAEPTMQIVALPLQGATPADLEAAQMDAVLTFSDSERELAQGGAIRPGRQLHRLLVGEGAASFTLEIASAGAYALFTEHHPDEFGAALLREGEPLAPAHSHAYKPDHEHDEAVSSVGITLGGDLDADRLNRWLGELLRTQGPDIFRMKGVLSIKGQPRRFVFQGVHMLFDGRPDREWGGDPRTNKLIFIGRNLDRAALNEGFVACLA